jgi:ectoine hydroxylase
LGVLEAGHDLKTTSYPLWTLDNETIGRLVAKGGIVAPTGGPGTGLFFHSCLVHGSNANMTPWGRIIVYVTANRVDNAIRRFKRPEYIAHRDFTAIVPLADDCLAEDLRDAA